jgi:DNA-binding MarR family transcriptional regulator
MSRKPARSDAVVRAMDALRSLVRALGSSARRSTSSGHVTGARLFALRAIGRAPGISVNDLAAVTFARQSTVSEVVAALVQLGLVQRKSDTSDARQVHLTLTARGRRAVETTDPTAQERLLAGLEALPPRARESLAQGLERWLVEAGLESVPPTMFFENHEQVTTPKRRRKAT